MPGTEGQEEVVLLSKVYLLSGCRTSRLQLSVPRLLHNWIPAVLPALTRDPSTARARDPPGPAPGQSAVPTGSAGDSWARATLKPPGALLCFSPAPAASQPHFPCLCLPLPPLCRPACPARRPPVPGPCLPAVQLSVLFF